MAKRIHALYSWRQGSLEAVGSISDAKLRAWEYSVESEARWEVRFGDQNDTVRPWRSARPDLAPATLLVGDTERGEA